MTRHGGGVVPETKEEMSKAQPSEENKDGAGTTEPASTLLGNSSSRAALRREQ
jgi:hypothetical protein